MHQIKKIFGTFYTLFLNITQPLRDWQLKKLIRGNRVLVLGSGQTSNELSRIPTDMLVFCCNLSPQTLIDKGLTRKVDLYIGNPAPLRDYVGKIEPLLQKLEITFFLTRSPAYLRKRKDISSYKKVIRDRSAGDKSMYLTKKIFDAIPKTNSRKKTVSTGIALVEYALYYGASEVYLLGIDIDTSQTDISNRSTDSKNGVYSHQHEDHWVMEQLSKKYINVWSASSQSPITKFIPFKKMQ